MKLTVGIPVYNEEANIGYLIEEVFKHGSLYDIDLVIVSSGSTDQTNYIVRSYSKVRLIIEQDRLGKMSAIKKIITYAKGEYILFIDGDISIDAQMFHFLIEFVNRDEPLAVAGRVNCVSNNSIFDELGVLSCKAWHGVRLQAENNNSFLYSSGYCMMVKTQILKSLIFNNDIVNDDAYLGLSLYNLGYNFKYLHEAIVYIKSPQNIQDFFLQKVRTRLGRRLIRSYPIVIKSAEKSWRKNVLNQIGLNNFHFVTTLLFLDLICRMAATVKYYIGYSSNIWRIIPSTKTIERDSE